MDPIRKFVHKYKYFLKTVMHVYLWENIFVNVISKTLYGKICQTVNFYGVLVMVLTQLAQNINARFH